MHRHAEAEDTGAAVAQVTWALSAELRAELAWVPLAELASEGLAEVIWRAFPEVPLTMPRELAMERGVAMERPWAMERAFATERAFSVVAFQF